MKGFLKVLGVILMILAMAGFTLLGVRDFIDSSKMAELEASAATAGGPSREMAESVLAGTKKLLGAEDLSAAAFRNGGIVSLLAALLLLALIVLLLARKDRRYVRFLFALLVVLVAAVLLNPAFNAGPNGPMSARSLALNVGLTAVIGALLGQVSFVLRRKAG